MENEVDVRPWRIGSARSVLSESPQLLENQNTGVEDCRNT